MAGKFKFRLETLLRVRQRAFEAAQQVVAERLRTIERERQMLAAAQAQIDDQVALSRAARSAGQLDVGALTGHRLHVRFLQRRLMECGQRVAAHERELARERAAMVEASVAVKALEKLKERQAARHAAEISRQEAAEQAELALQIHRRQTRVVVGEDG